jgi:hypothetical protein
MGMFSSSLAKLEREREREREYCPVRKCSRLARSISPVRGGAT